MSAPKNDASERLNQLAMLGSLFEAIEKLSDDQNLVQELAKLGGSAAGEWFARVDAAEEKSEAAQ